MDTWTPRESASRSLKASLKGFQKGSDESFQGPGNVGTLGLRVPLFKGVYKGYNKGSIMVLD